MKKSPLPPLFPNVQPNQTYFLQKNKTKNVN